MPLLVPISVSVNVHPVQLNHLGRTKLPAGLTWRNMHLPLHLRLHLRLPMHLPLHLPMHLPLHLRLPPLVEPLAGG